jgi:hypothetical protein
MAAFRLGITTGGTAPSNWYTENGPNPLLSLLGLTAEGDYRQRTIKNIKDSDGTVLLSLTSNSPGSVLTRNEAKRQGKPFLEVDLNAMIALQQLDAGDTTLTLRTLVLEASTAIQTWLVENTVRTLNVAGNREKSKDLATTHLVDRILTDVFTTLDIDGYVIRDSDF